MQAVLAAVKNSFAALRQRLFCAEPGDMHPLFEVAVELSVPAVALSPPLPTIQQAVNSAIKQARLVLSFFATLLNMRAAWFKECMVHVEQHIRRRSWAAPRR